jgi:hypothetical protein
MKKPVLTILILCAIARIHASGLITASITVTNATTNGMTFAVGSDTRTFTNQVFNPATQVITNTDTTGCGGKTNLFQQIGLHQFSQLTPIDTGSNTFQLVGPCSYSFSVTVSAGYASVSYSTQTCLSATPVGIPFSAYYANPNSATNVASQFATDFSNYGTNPIIQASPVAKQLLGTSNTQSVVGQKTFSNTNSVWNGQIVASPSIGGTVSNLSAGQWTNATLENPTSTNLVNYGNAISSPFMNGVQSEQFGAGAHATNDDSLAVGDGALAYGPNTIAVGATASAGNFDSAMAVGAGTDAEGNSAAAIGSGANAFGGNATALGVNAVAQGDGTTAIGSGAHAAFTNSTAVGQGATTTATNQVMLGAPGSSAVVPNSLSVGTNLTVGNNTTIGGNFAVTGIETNGAHLGTNNYLTGSDIAFARNSISSLANGNNAAIPVGTNVYCAVSGPSGAFAICGVANGRDGKLIIIENSTGQTLTIANESGGDPTAANRIKTGTAGDVALTNNPGMVRLIYSGAAGRWILEGHN